MCMASRDFKEWMSHFTDSISSYDYYIDFEKVIKNAESLKVELHILNSLIGSKNIEDEFRSIISQYPKTLKCIPILLAVRNNEIKAMDEDGKFDYHFDKPNQTVDQYVIFMKKTGLFDLISNHLVNNLYDYVLGVETGLDSNGRKNRGGHQMEDLVETYVKDLVPLGCRYYSEMYLSEIERKWNLDLSSISNSGKAEKRFDYVIEYRNEIYGMEVNFYASSGSKLNETARSYKMIATESKGINRFHFVWITDGLGWNSAKGNLKETFDVLESMYSIHDLENGCLKTLIVG